MHGHMCVLATSLLEPLRILWLGWGRPSLTPPYSPHTGCWRDLRPAPGDGHVWSPVCALVELGNLPLCGDHRGLMDPPWQDGVTVIIAGSLSRSFVTQPFITL